MPTCANCSCHILVLLPSTCRQVAHFLHQLDLRGLLRASCGRRCCNQPGARPPSLRISCAGAGKGLRGRTHIIRCRVFVPTKLRPHSVQSSSDTLLLATCPAPTVSVAGKERLVAAIRRAARTCQQLARPRQWQRHSWGGEQRRGCPGVGCCEGIQLGGKGFCAAAGHLPGQLHQPDHLLVSISHGHMPAWIGHGL